MQSRRNIVKKVQRIESYRQDAIFYKHITFCSILLYVTKYSNKITSVNMLLFEQVHIDTDPEE